MNPETATLTRKQIETEGFAVVSDDELGFSPESRAHLHREFFRPGILRSYPDDLPVDRERARDVVRYDWNDDQLTLTEYESIVIENRGERPEPREYARVEVLTDPCFEEWIRLALGLVPGSTRDTKGTFGVNLFRTYTNVVTRPHQDGEKFVFIYVLDKVGQGAQTWLYGPEENDPVLFQDTLGPGDLLVFEDARFRHSVTPLENPPGGTARRDVLVCTVNYDHTYPLD
ncbi:2OG-Fe dioxygenase [Amycolatopsis marina]|uniref:2OG-Fe dioxygenase n=1 Tax=Amycolatopsis marina TaxID=490629 RepID=A0A1I0YUC4_9PSEU|nr:2OG-Fe dioxygenase family protein [Amycolatopsis marina]SFB16587.1 2OG-Fe dioxygenase [Amycolatopsis marina]